MLPYSNDDLQKDITMVNNLGGVLRHNLCAIDFTNYICDSIFYQVGVIESLLHKF